MVLERGRALLEDLGIPSRVGAEIGARRLEKMARMSLQEAVGGPGLLCSRQDPKLWILEHATSAGD